MTKRKPESRGVGTAAFLDQLARDIVDRGDVVGIDGLSKAEYPSEERRSKKGGVLVERAESPSPGGQIGADQQTEYN